MIQSRLIGLTGSIATGKSTVTGRLKAKGFCVIDGDEIARQVVEPDETAYLAIVEYFGQKILKEDTSIDRKKLGDIVFNNQEELDILNQITHREIFKKIRLEILNQKAMVIFLDIPLLFEIYDDMKKEGIDIEKTVLVYTPKEIQLERLIKRDGLSRQEAMGRINSQMDIDRKKKLTDIIIDNSKDLNHLYREIDEALEKLNLG